MKEVMRRGGWGEINLGGMKIYTLAYTDDEDGIRSMIERLEGYLEKKGLELNVEKSKILRFRKGGERERNINWKWKGKVIEEKFSYLGYVMQRNVGQEAQIRDRLRKSAAVMGQDRRVKIQLVLRKNQEEWISEYLKSDWKESRWQRMAQIDEINAARVQEEVEREWRQREKEEALKKLEAQRILQRDREEQINNKRVMQAIEIERERREFEKIVHVQRAAFCKEKKELEQKQQQILIHRNEILKQVNEKERERIAERQQMFAEGLTIRAETAMRKKKLQDTMERKCQEMRENKIPDIYINEVKRMIKNI
ncbi:hypothetical protein ACFW04_014473 [Cataglyphis niger]